MSKILGLDLGTNSIGWAVIENNNGKTSLLQNSDHPTGGVIIFPEGVNVEAKTGSLKSRAAERTGHRGARRIKFRRKLRKYETLLVLAEKKMCPLTIEEVIAWKKSGFKIYPDNKNFLDWLKTDHFGIKDSKEGKAIQKTQKNNPYYFRDKFSREKYDWQNNLKLAYELGRAFYHIAQRRGFKSNRLEQSDENVIADVKEHIQDTLAKVNDSLELHHFIEDFYNELDLKGKTNKDLDATQQKIKSILNYLLKVNSNKIKGKDYSSFDAITTEINRYINKPENLGKVKGSIKELSQKIQESTSETLGQYFWLLYQEDRHDKSNKIRTLYTAREEHYEHEFNIICEKQDFPPELQESLHKAIFYQRPLKSQKGLVGKCTLEKNKPRCPVSRPEFEEFRMWSFINNIKIKTPEDEQLRELTLEEKNKVSERFYLKRATFKMTDIAHELFGKGADVAYYKEREAKNARYLVNYKLNTTISGNPVSTAFKNLLGDEWKTRTFHYTTKDSKGKLVEREVDYTDLWHVLFTFEDTKKLKDFAVDNLKLNYLDAQKFSKIVLPQGYANLSLKAINNILPWLKPEKGLIYSHAVFMANLSKIIDKQIWNDLKKRKEIEAEIGYIIDTQRDETRKALAINSLIKTYQSAKREDRPSYSKEAISAFKNDLENKFKEIYGPVTWDRKGDKEQYLKDAFILFEENLKALGTKDAFKKIKRLDERVKDFLLDNGLVKDSKQLEKLYHPSDIESFKPQKVKDNTDSPVFVNGEPLEILPSPRSESIKNPVLMRAMHQLRKLINELLFEGIIDKKTRIHLELAREVNDNNKRKAWKQWQDELRDRREKAKESIKELYKKQCNEDISPTEDDVTRFILWEEQSHKEIYEDECSNISICNIIGSDPDYDIEHTIPRSRSWDNSMMNKTLCSKTFNRNVKGSKIPFELEKDKWEEILSRIAHWKEKYEKLDAEIKTIRPSSITDIDKRNEKIVEKHLKTFKRDYWKGKHDRFMMKEVPEGFKNSQTTDTGLITRFARTYLSCLFRTSTGNSNVRVVNGVAVSEFRKAWGLQEEYQKKSRRNHIHHCIDAVTIACMTKGKYDDFAEEWRKAEEESKYDVKLKLGKYKPWKTFTEDVKNLENEILVVHTNKDNVPKQTKKKKRVRGKIQRYKDGNPIYQEGDTARGSLHKETFYGAIKHEEDEKIKYVIRKDIALLSASDIKNIVDPSVRKLVDDLVKKYGIKILQDDVWQNKDKGIRLKKVRCFAPTVTDPIHLKLHRNLSEHNHKQNYHVMNDENYVIAIYEGKNDKGKVIKGYEVINMLNAVHHYNCRDQENHSLVPNHIQVGKKTKVLIPFKYLLRKGDSVLFYDTEPEELFNLTNSELNTRMYKLVKFDKSGRLYFRPHSEARPATELKEVYEFNTQKLSDQVRLPVSKFQGLVEGIDFRFSITGKIEILQT